MGTFFTNVESFKAHIYVEQVSRLPGHVHSIFTYNVLDNNLNVSENVLVQLQLITIIQ